MKKRTTQSPKYQQGARPQPHYFVVPLIIAAIATLGSWITTQGLPWYATLATPTWTPPGSVIGAVWTTLYVLAAFAVVFSLDAVKPAQRRAIVLAFIANGVLNLAWSVMFFGAKELGVGFLTCGTLALSVAVCMAMVRPVSRAAFWLLAPYLAWVSFATFLNFVIWTLNI